MKKFLTITLIVLLFVIGITYSVVDFIKNNEEEKRLEEERIELTKLNASLVIDSVELAYTTALTTNMGVYPTLEQVKNNFNNANANWIEDSKIESIKNDFECSVVIEEKTLKVTCLEYTTTTDLIIRN